MLCFIQLKSVNYQQLFPVLDLNLFLKSIVSFVGYAGVIESLLLGAVEGNLQKFGMCQQQAILIKSQQWSFIITICERLTFLFRQLKLLLSC